LKDCRANKADRLRVGNIETRRDFVDVRDVAAAFDAVLERGRPGEVYNVGSGTDVSIAEIIDEIMEVSGLRVPMEVASSRFRNTDVARISADVAKITAETDWRPKIDLKESLRDMWNWESDG